MLFEQLTPTRHSTSELLDALRQREVAVFGHSTPGQTRTPNEGNGTPKRNIFSGIMHRGSASRIVLRDASRIVEQQKQQHSSSNTAAVVAATSRQRRRRAPIWRVGLLFCVSAAERVLRASWLWAIHQQQRGFLQQRRTCYAAAVKTHAAADEWPRARTHKAHSPQGRHKTTAQLSKREFDAAAAAETSPPPLLRCCCCCAAASAARRSAMHRGARSAMLIRDTYKYAESPEQNVPLRCSISLTWRSGLTRGSGTKTATSRCRSASRRAKRAATPAATLFID